MGISWSYKQNLKLVSLVGLGLVENVGVEHTHTWYRV